MPGKISPMLCTLTKQPVTDPHYFHEIKFDGYRIIAHVNNNKVRLDSRSGLDYTSKYPSVAAALKKIKAKVILDGEVCALNEEGKPDFDTLQKPPEGSKLVYYAFDILWLNGYNLMELEATARKKILQDFLGNNKTIRYSESFADAIQLYKEMQEMGMEGIVSKRKDSEYIEGNRGSSWFKTPTEMRQEYVIGGWVESDKGRPFASLLFGAYKGKKLEWIGHAGGGFKTKEMPVMLKKFQRLEIKQSPFSNKVEYRGVVHWVKPELVANFKFATFTKSGRIRKPAIFLGFRTDKAPKDVVPEIAVELKDNKKPAKKLPPLSYNSNWRNIEKQHFKQKEVIDVAGCDIEVSDIEREVWKNVSKMELIQYYHHVAPYILPHIKNRPQSLHVKLVNANAPGFYIKDMEGRQPGCAEIFPDKRKHKKAGKRDRIDYLVCNNEATLLWMVNLGCIDINPWTSRVENINHPDFIIIDLDPSDDDFNKAIDSALAAKQVFDKYGVKAFPKTSGKTGIHLYLPCTDFSFAEARNIAERICQEIHELVPSITTTNVSVQSRGKKLYLDPNQNDYADTVAAAYSARPFHIPTVSTPLDWKEINSKFDPSEFTIHTIVKRLERKGDLFLKTLDKKTAAKNNSVLKKLI